jgi:oligoendopeptidase F
VNYVYGGLLALKYYQLYSRDREAFVLRYIALLKNGFDAPLATLLKKFLDIDLFDSSLLTDDLNLLDHRLKQLESGRSEFGALASGASHFTPFAEHCIRVEH